MNDTNELQLFVQQDGVETPLFSFNDKGITIREDISWEEFRAGLKYFKGAEERLKFGRSQYIAFGYRKFGKGPVDDSMAQLEFLLDDVRKAIDLASVPAELQLPNLTSEHLYVLARADLTKKEKAKWAKDASEQKLTPNTLKVSIIAGEVITPQQAKKHTSGQLTINGIRMEVDIWLQRVGGLEGIRKMPPAAQSDICCELEQMAKLWLALTGQVAVRPDEDCDVDALQEA